MDISIDRQEGDPAYIYIMGDAEMNAPLVKSMDRLEEGETFVFRQLTQYAELFLPYDQQNKYMLSAAPEGVKAASSQHDGAMWKPTGAELRGTSPIFLAYEMSSFMQRCLFGCLGAKNLRPFDMNFVNSQMAMKLDAEGWRNIKENKDVLEDDDGFRISRPCKCGGCCLEPFVTFVRSAQNNDVGFVRENFEPYSEKCFLATCKCTHVHDVFVKSKTPTYQLVVNGACCGAHNNCCGATCFKEAMIFDILDTNGKVLDMCKNRLRVRIPAAMAVCAALVTTSAITSSPCRKTHRLKRNRPSWAHLSRSNICTSRPRTTIMTTRKKKTSTRCLPLLH